MERKLNGIALILFGMMLGQFSPNLIGLLGIQFPFVTVGLALGVVGLLLVFLPKKG